jgi:hypothetical protein
MLCMKSVGLLFITLCIASSSFCQTWRSTGVENPGSEIFYDAENVLILNIGSHKNVIKTWCREKFYNLVVAGKVFSTGWLVTSYAFDCAEKRWMINELIYYRPGGQVIMDYTYEPEWHEFPPGSPISLLFNSICRKYSNSG